MNTHTFGNHSLTCPICQRSGHGLKQQQISNGLFTCPYCQERLVVCWSGHYVRDPHNCKQGITITHVLRRESRPWVRILRDFSFIKRTAAIVAIGSALILGVSAIALENLTPEQNNLRPSEKVEEIDPPPNSL